VKNSLNERFQKEKVYVSHVNYLTVSSEYPLLTAISTKLQSPVTIIQSNIQLLKNFCNCSENALLNETFSFCEDSIESIQGFIEKIKFLCTSDIYHANPKPEWNSLQLLVNHVLVELRQQNFDTTRINSSYLVDDYITIPDKYLFIRILVNLLSNALKFSNQKVELLFSVSGNELSIVVRDSGIGIPASQIPEIFDPFIRGTNATNIKGSGLGLSVVAKTVKWLNGNITLHSEVGEGTEFKIIFPYFDGQSYLVHPSPQELFNDCFRTRESQYNQITGTISHELRTSIAILKSNIQLLKKLTFTINEELKNKNIGICETSLMDLESVFDNIPLLNLTIQSGVNGHLPKSSLSKLHVN